MAEKICKDTGKITYDQIGAQLALASCINRRSGSRTERRKYQCKFCGGWHLTSKGKN